MTILRHLVRIEHYYRQVLCMASAEILTELARCTTLMGQPYTGVSPCIIPPPVAHDL